MAKFCAFTVAAVVVFPFALIALAGIAGLLAWTVGLTVSGNSNVLILALLAFAAVAIANAVYRRILQRITRKTA